MEGLKAPLEFGLPIPGLTRGDSIIFTNTLIVMAIIFLVSVLVTRRLKLRPNRLQILLETVWEWLAGIMKTSVGPVGSKYLPLIVSLFLFILFSNLIGLVPGFVSPTSNINTNLALAVIIVFIATPFVGIRTNGLGGYLKQKAGPIKALSPFVFIFETIGELARPISLTIRLFTNVKSGDILIMTLIVVALGMPYNILIPVLSIIALAFGLFVSFIQAYVFAFLSIIYFSLAVGHE
jgi:F-type H+-transporting ATPase subunit a